MTLALFAHVILDHQNAYYSQTLVYDLSALLKDARGRESQAVKHIGDGHILIPFYEFTGHIFHGVCG